MGPVEIIIVTVISFIMLSIISYYIYKKINGEPIQTCDCVHAKKLDLVSEYYKKYPKTCSKKHE